ncbi:ArsR family transcriptional regulator [Pseudonocardia dioxanivorans]|uniref:ArsR family transcriptional regulator n=1 Tax=Pseudonocardia dioxanivorans TaxID=240495 RepID=UPI000CD0B4DB|nr:ArsR family transcriptional regulator [Pseudonocardia dioxanivorans]
MTDQGEADLSVIGAALSDRGRCRMLMALDDGRALPASMLAAEAGVSAATASAHLKHLRAAGLLEVVASGRYRYYRLAGDEVGRLLEQVARLSPAQPIRSLREGTRAHAMRLARCCYDHVAGRLGVALTDTLRDRGHLVEEPGLDVPRPRGRFPDDATYLLTPGGREALTAIGVAVPEAVGVRCCTDWTEQRHHVAGPLGRALLDTLVDRGWVRRTPRSRALRPTDDGRAALREHFGVPWPPPVGVRRLPA